MDKLARAVLLFVKLL